MKSSSKRPTKPSVPVRALPRIVRETCSFSYQDSASTIKRRIAGTKDRALATARQIGIRCPDVNCWYDIDVFCAFTDYPMYLLGPNAPQIRTAKDALYHGDGRGKYTIVIRPKD